MRQRRSIWILLCLLCAAGVWFLWHRENGRGGSPSRPQAPVAPAGQRYLASQVSSGVISTNVMQISAAEWNTNKFAGRLSNTTKPLDQLVNDRHAILLANALIDTAEPLNFVFPKNLQPQGDPGAYIVQARGPIDNAFRALLAQAGAAIVSYIPNDAYLVRASVSVADTLDANPLVQAVVPYEPYYKIQSSLLYPAVNQIQLADGEALNLGLFADHAPVTVQQIEKLGGQVVGNDQSPFGPVVRVIPPQNWTVLATLSGVQIVEPFHPRSVANDLSRAANGVAANSLTAANYLGLTGSNIIVEVNDTGIDAQHPDLTAGGAFGKLSGVIGDAQSLVDTNGHGTHVAGIIAGDGAKSTTVTNAPGSILPGGMGTNYQFRGMAPGATLYSVAGIAGGAEAAVSDFYLQETPAQTNALISNNSWVYEGDSVYDLAAASYDAATRDALPFVTGSQPVLFVFAAGNDGDGSDSEDLGGGTADSIDSPATAKNVITVGAIQEDRNISVTVTNADGTPNTTWADETSTGYRVAGFSSRGNVGIGIEGTYGRYKPDVCAPGTFTLSTRSEQWDIGTYFYQNPTNDQSAYYSGFVVQPGSIVSRPFPFVPTNAVELQIWTFPNANSPFSFADLPTLIGLFGTPGYQYGPYTNYPVTIPPGPPTLAQILSTEGFLGGFNFAVSNNTPNQVIFDLQTDIITTNGSGNYFLALSNLDNSIGTPNPASTGPGPYYRYETGTSMAAADVSGVLALMQQFYFNAYHTTPSPAMLKAMLINGGQATGLYNFQVQNTLNYEGWGLVNLPGSLPPGVTNQTSQTCSAFVQDQSPTNALATGASQTYQITLNTNATPLRVTLAWTDPPGDPAAAIKLVNNLVLVVTNFVSGFSNPTNVIIYYGNDIPASSTVNSPHSTNDQPVIDSINNVQNVYLPPGAGTNFTVTVLGYRVNVNAVTAQSNNVVQDYALVISTGNSGLTNVMTVTAPPASSVYNATGDQQITYLSPNFAGTQTAYQELQNQFAGANTPLLGTNTIVFTPAAPEGFGPNDWQVTTGMTNQWQFYVVTNTFGTFGTGFTNAAFITFNPNAPDPDTLSVPRMGVFGGTVGNATREADIDMYVTTDSNLLVLSPLTISNCVVGTQVGATVVVPPPTFAGASLGRGTTEFVVDTNSQNNEVYYIGVKSEDQESAEYGFIAIFSQLPFSTMNHGVQTVNGVPVPMNIPDGSPTLPGKGYVFGLAIYPETVGTVTVTNYIWHQNFGDLIGTLTLNGGHADVLNNHDSLGPPPTSFDGPPPNPPGFELIYDDSAGGGIPGSRPSDGPGSLIGYIGQQGFGVWLLNEVDDSLTQTGTVWSYTTTIYPHQSPTTGVVSNSVPGGGWVYDFIDVTNGAINLTIYATNVTATANPPVELFVNFGSEPTTNNFDAMGIINVPVGNGWVETNISLGPPLESGRYYYGFYNPNPSSPSQEIVWQAVITGGPAPGQVIFSSTDTPIPILDDAVTLDSIYVPANQIISSVDVAIAVQHPRISDLVFHLISPDGTRDLLMENRGGTDPNGAGGIGTVTTNSLLGSFEGATGDYTANEAVGGSGWTVGANQVSVQTDPANAYAGTSNYLALANGMLYANLPTTPGATYTLTFQYRGPGIAGWWRGENNYLDSSGNGNNASAAPNVTFTNGEVVSDSGLAFHLNGSNADVQIPDAASLKPASVTAEAWVKLDSLTSSVAAYPGLQYIIFKHNSSSGGFFEGYNLEKNRLPAYDPNGTDVFRFEATSGGNQVAAASTTIPQTNVWYHLAGTFDNNSQTLKIYVNGVLEGTATTGFPLDYGNGYPLYIGTTGEGFDGRLEGAADESSVYDRALSDSEIQAIYNDGINGNVQGGNGKFDPTEFLFSPPLSLAEAQVSVNGGTPTMLLGNNTSWQTYTVSFKATQTSTLLQIQGLEPGMLLDAASVTVVTTNYSYLVFTENTNLTTTPIKFAIPPFLPNTPLTNVAASGFDAATATNYAAPATITDGANLWNVLNNQVSVVNDPVNADSGNQFLALANGTVSSTLPTVAGRNYVLTFRYRGPGIAGWWRGENNTLDSSSYGNNGYWYNGTAVYTNGEVGNAFSLNGVNNFVIANPPSGSWNPALTNGFTIEGWINPATTSPGLVLVEFERVLGSDTGADVGVGFGYDNNGPGSLLANVKDTANGDHTFYSAAGVVTNNGWQHVALTYNRASGFAALYRNGVIVAPANLGSFTPETAFTNFMIGGRTTFVNPSSVFAGGMDEMSMYDRPLSDSEIQAIYADGTAGKFDPNEFPVSPTASLAEAQVSVGGGTPATLYGNNTTWQTKTIVFTATQNGTPLQITGVEPGMLLDSFALSQTANDIYYLPEQPLDVYDGLNAQGPWTLEIQDDRVGATNPTPLLLSWQLRFNFVTLGTNGIGIPPGITATNVIPANDWAYYQINVPANADVATNILVFATGPLNMWFNTNNVPPPGDVQLLNGVTSGSSTLSTFSVPTNIVPGGVYYIGLQNTNSFQVTNGFVVNFHYFQTTPLPPGVPFTNTVAGAVSGDGVDYYSIAVPTNADYATNLLLFSTQPVNVWFNQNKDPVCLTPPDNLLIANATNGVAILNSNSAPPLMPGLTYYLAVQNTNASNATYALEVNFHTISILTNGVPTTNSVPTNSFAYYEVQVPTNADYATNLLLFASLPVNVWFNQTGLPTGTNPPDYLLISDATSGAFTLSAGSTPPLVPGATYYLGVQNTNAVTVNFGLEVNFHLKLPQIISGPTITATNINGTNGFLLQWSGPTNYQYIIEWTTNLALPNGWSMVMNPVINVTYAGTNGNYSWFDDGSLTGGFPPQKFYRVLANLLSGPITTNSPTATNDIAAGTVTPLTVSVPANAVAASNVLVSATGPVNVWFSQTTPFTGGTNAGDVLMLSNVTSGSFLLTGSSAPPLVPGANYYLGLQNTGTTNVSFVFQVNFAYAASSSNVTTIPTITLTNIGGTNGILLTWYAPTNYRYQVQWTTALAPAPIAWTTIPGVVLTNLPSFAPTNGIGEFQYFDNGSLTGGFGTVKFYRLIAWPPGTTIPPSLVITSVKAAPGGVQIQWAGSTNYVYDIVWTTNLALPTASWNVLSNLTSPTLTYSGGVFTFTDTNVLAPEFFRVLLLP
jgi:subtilisin-like proprotein convertase family protein